MAKIFLDANESRNGGLLTGDVIFGSTGTENVTINAGATGIRVEGTVEGVVLANAPAAYTYLAEGNNLVVFLAGVQVARIIVQDDADGTAINFPAGASSTITVGAGGIAIGGTIVPTGTAGVVIPGNLNPDTALTTALGTLAAAQTALGDFNDTLVDDLTTGGVDESDVDDVAFFTTNGVDADLDAALGPVNFQAAGDNARAGLIADGRAALQANINAEAADLAAARTTAGTDVVAAVDAANVSATALEAAIDAAAAADIVEDGERAKFDSVNGPNIGIVGGNVSIGGTLVATLVSGIYVKETSPGAVAALGAATGFDAYLATLQAETNASVAAENASTALSDAVASVVALENGDTSITSADLAPGVITTGVDLDGNSVVTIDYTVSVATPTLPTVSPTQGVVETTETATVTFTGLADTQSTTVNGLTLTATGGALTAAQVATFFSTGAVPVNGVDTGSYTGAFIEGPVGAGNTVTYTSSTSGDVTDILVSGAGSFTVNQGVDGVTELANVVFTGLVAGQSITVEGLTLTASTTLSSTTVAQAFDNLVPGDHGVAPVGGTFTGTLSGDFTSGAAGGSTVVFTSTVADTDVAAIDIAAAGGSPTAPHAQAVVDERADLAAAQEQLVDLNTAVTAYETALAQQDVSVGLNDAVTAARDAIQDSVADGGLGVTLRQDADNFTAGSDLYLFAQGADHTLTGFGTAGTDRIFIAGDFTVVNLTDQVVGVDAVGSAAALEVFIQQQGANTVIYVEKGAFDGSETAGLGDAGFDGTVITLANTTATDVTYSGGYFTIA